MPPIERSPGPFPSGKAFSAVSRDQLLKAYYQTTSSRDVPGKVPTNGSTGENYNDIHNIGRRKTKYMDFQQSRSPLQARDSCVYNKDFTPLPLGDCAINKALAAQFKGGLAAGGGKHGVDLPMDGWSTNEADLRAHRPEDMRRAKLPSSQNPQEKTDTLNGCGGLLETKSHEQRVMMKPDMNIARARRAPKPPGNLELGAKHGVHLRSYYGSEHSLGSLQSPARSASTPELDGAGFPPLSSDPEIFRVRRAPHMMPGK